MFTINKSKIQTDQWRIQIFRDELYVAGKDMQLNLLIDDLVMEDRIQKFVIITPERVFLFGIKDRFTSYSWQMIQQSITITNPTTFSIFQPIAYSYTGRNRVETTINIEFKRDDYWKVRKWFMKLLDLVEYENCNVP